MIIPAIISRDVILLPNLDDRAGQSLRLIYVDIYIFMNIIMCGAIVFYYVTCAVSNIGFRSPLIGSLVESIECSVNTQTILRTDVQCRQ